MLFRPWLLLMAIVIVFCVNPAQAQETLPIGEIQGRGSQSEYLERVVRFRGIVTGILEDENSRGTRFYTVFVQDLPGLEDGDPLTSDGLAIFVGARRPALAVGDIAVFSGRVTEFYGLSELDNNDLYYTLESRNNPLPEPIELDPPADNAQSAAYLERFEAMRVSLPKTRVVGPAHIGCGFHVIRADTGLQRIIISTAGDPAGQIVGVLHPSDVDCDAMPKVAHGDEVEGLIGPLTYHFDRFKIVHQEPADILVNPADRDAPNTPPEVPEGGFVIATFNVENYFDTKNNTGTAAEPLPSDIELTLKQAKLAATIGVGLGCPAFLGLQEVENADLLSQLVERLKDHCGFRYQISHMDSPDARGAETALLSDPALFTVSDVHLRQGCTDLDTGIIDPNVLCQSGQQPLFSRPPLQVVGAVDGQRFTLLVTHFKSKRGGVQETAPRRLAQAEQLRRTVEELLAAGPDTDVIVLGDFNDYDGSELMNRLSEQQTLVDALQGVPDDSRYSYIFDGASQLIDWILVSPPLAEFIAGADILHTNADYPFNMAEYGDRASLRYRSSDHDVPYVIIDLNQGIEPTKPAPTVITPLFQPATETSPLATAATLKQAPDSTPNLSLERQATPDRGVVAERAPEPTVTTEPQELTTAIKEGQSIVVWGLILAIGFVAMTAAAVIGRRLSQRA
jgi:predicted extracellular nuclease